MKTQKNKSIWFTITNINSLSRKEYIKLIRRVAFFVGLGFIASFAVFIVIAVIGGIGHVFNIILSANMELYLLAFAAVFAGYLLRFIKWNYYIKKLKIHVPASKNFIVYMSQYSMNITPGKIGRVLVAYTLGRLTSIKTSTILPVVTIDIFTDFLGVGLLALISALYFDEFVIYVVIIDAVLTLPYLFILNDWFYNFIKRLFKKRRFIETFTLYGDEYFASQSTLNKPSTYLVSIAVTLPAAFLNAMALYFTLLAVGLAPHVVGSAFIESSSNLFGMITGIPGNIGVTDGSLVALIGTLFKTTAATSSAVTIMTRLATLWFGILIGGALLIYSFRYWTAPRRRKRQKA
ncbi:flippase-like domain-containing protein [Candidatus Marsarchaeota archaeon]|nr:flippase-like domain-containing protein [Candidatus Marsarchaeota archaeon]MCL5404896.1 flippase-like domain-containing protein [Candidatus Marsarchaeota archaeon]